MPASTREPEKSHSGNLARERPSFAALVQEVRRQFADRQLPAPNNRTALERASRYRPVVLKKRFAAALLIRNRKRWPYNRSLPWRFVRDLSTVRPSLSAI
jgi:hypothetical protein